MLRIVIIDPTNSRFYEINNRTIRTVWETTIDLAPSSLSFTVIKGEQLPRLEGFEVKAYFEGKQFFSGYITDRSKTQTGDLSVVAQDQSFYLKTEVVKKVINHTASTIFESICKEFNIKYATLTQAEKKIENRIADGETLWEIMNKAINETATLETRLYIIRDVVGVLTFYAIDTLLPNQVNVKYPILGEGSRVIGFNYNSSIAEDTYNRVVVVYKDSKKNKREVYNEFDNSTESSVKKWGILQKVASVDFELTPAKAQEIAKRILQAKNRATTSFSITAFGDINVKAGDVVILNFPELFEVEKLKNLGYYIVKSCSHTFGSSHEMNIEVLLYYTVGE